MSFFLLWDRQTTVDEPAARAILREVGWSEPNQYDVGRYRLLHGPRLLTGESCTAARGGDRLFLAGSLSYRGEQAQDGLDRLLADMAEGVVHWPRLHGNFSVLAEIQSQLVLLHDGHANHNLFHDDSGSVLSTSMLALAYALPGSRRANRHAFLELIATGLVTGPETMLQGVRRIETSEDGSFPFAEIALLRDPEVRRLPSRSFRGSFEEAVEQQLSELDRVFDDLTPQVEQFGADTGVSGGFDSRLVLAEVARHYQRWQAHSHWKKVPDRDLRVARELLEVLGRPLITVPAAQLPEMEDGELREMMRRALIFYDGHVRVNYSILYPYRTPEYRRQVLGDHGMAFSGIGGEQYRNTERMLPGRRSLPEWYRHRWIYQNSNRSFVSRAEEDAFVARMAELIGRRLGLERIDTISRPDVLRYNNEVWIPAGAGIRAHVESTLTPFYSPFADARVSREAYRIIPHFGAFGRFEGEMIRRLHPGLASVESSYGFPLDREPAKSKLRTHVKAVMRGPLRAPYFSYILSRKGGAQSSYATMLLERFESVRELNSSLPDLGLPLDWAVITSTEESFNRSLGAMFFLRTFSDRVDW